MTAGIARVISTAASGSQMAIAAAGAITPGWEVHANAAMRVDDHFKNTCMVDLVGGSVSFYDTRVRLLKA